MAYNVKFLRGNYSVFKTLTPDSHTFYYVVDDSETKELGGDQLYLGSLKLSSEADLNAAITNITSQGADITAIKNALDGISLTAKGSVKKYVDDAIKGINSKIGTLDSLDTSAKTDLVAAINEVKGVADSAKSNAGLVSIDTTKTTEGYLKSYTISQGDKTLATIDIPKDLVVTAGETVEATAGAPIKIGETSYTSGEFLKLTIANQTDPVYINATKLVDIYTAQKNATQVQLTVTNGVISAEIVDGSVDTAALGKGAVTTDKIADSNVTKAKLATDVQTTLGKADKAVQTIATGTGNGSISVDGKDVAVKGLGSAAYTASSAYDAAGAAQTVSDTLKGTAADTSDNDTIYGAKAAAKDAETSAKSYTDTALTWGTF